MYDVNYTKQLACKKVLKFLVSLIINMKNNYHQTFVVHLMTYIHVKPTLFTCYLFRLYKRHVKKE